jgi:pimeloyl-ACP methyl ester carboxylesterase
MRLSRPLRWLAAGAAVYLAVCALMFTLQHRLQYRPNPAPMDTAAAALPGLEVQALDTADGERLVAWWHPPRDARSPVVLYLHGNGANLAARMGRLRWLAQQGAGFLALSWRGYGGSTGTPSEAGLMTDARTAWAALAQRVAPERIVVFGESLGTTVAVMLAAEVPAAAVVLDSGFASVLDVASARYFWLPVPWLLREPFRADLAAPRVRVPVLQVHCRDDPVTPTASALRLHALLPQAAPMVVVDGRCHTPSLLRFEAPLREFLERVRAPAVVSGRARPGRRAGIRRPARPARGRRSGHSRRGHRTAARSSPPSRHRAWRGHPGGSRGAGLPRRSPARESSRCADQRQPVGAVDPRLRAGG